MYAKLINGELQIAPKSLRGNGVIVYNPPKSMYLSQGWKQMTYTDPPEAPEGYYYEPAWEEQEDEIVQVWAITPLPDDVDEVEAYDIIFGGME